MLLSWTENELTRYRSVSVDGAADGPIDLSAYFGVYLSPDGRWLVQDQVRAEGQEAGSSVIVTLITAPTIQHTVRTGGGPIPARLYWPVTGPHPSLDEVSILRRRDTLVVGVPTRLTLEGHDVAGRTLSIASSVVRWTSSDSAIVTIQATGEVVGRRAGSVIITGSAGGWREAAVRFTVTQGTVDTVLVEDWQSDWTGAWTSWGSPLPRIVAKGGNGIGRALLPNGDGEYSSGLMSRATFDARNGLAVEVELSTAITRPKWQFLQVGLSEPGPIAQSGPMGSGCSLRYPLGEGGENSKTLAGVAVDSAMAQGQWFRLRIQIFPDGTCGIALNGRVIRHDPLVRLTPGRLLVALGGQTVGSPLLVGRVTVLRGVPTDVGWGRLRE